MKDHILSESAARHNGILEHCMYCNTEFEDDDWRIERKWWTNYISTRCSNCHREHRFSDPHIHSIEDIIERK